MVYKIYLKRVYRSTVVNRSELHVLLQLFIEAYILCHRISAAICCIDEACYDTMFISLSLPPQKEPTKVEVSSSKDEVLVTQAAAKTSPAGDHGQSNSEDVDMYTTRS